jgi:hypothetical protein
MICCYSDSGDSGVAGDESDPSRCGNTMLTVMLNIVQCGVV